MNLVTIHKFAPPSHNSASTLPTPRTTDSDLPIGSILIKENFSPEKKTLMAITLMYRSKDFNPEANDWYWGKFDPTGKVAEMDTPKGKMQIAGKAKGCIECHSGAGDDYAFFND